jgi:hypothetical protein
MDLTKRIFALLTLICICLFISSQTSLGEQHQKYAINLKSKAVVLGPVVTLGDIGQVVISDSRARTELVGLRIGTAPPPGESTEISLTHIKRRLKTAGYGEYVSALRGPKNIRITTAPIEIDKAILKEEFAVICHGAFLVKHS